MVEEHSCLCGSGQLSFYPDMKLNKVITLNKFSVKKKGSVSASEIIPVYQLGNTVRLFGIKGVYISMQHLQISYSTYVSAAYFCS